MSRTKKSRKPATAPKAKPKLSKKELTQVEKRTKKLTGKKPGNRQLEAQKKPNKQAIQTNKDPRIGSKKPIPLVKEKPIKTSKEQTPVAAEIAPIEFAELDNLFDEILVDEETLIAELTDIEQDEKLHTISAKASDEVSEEEINYFNSKMERHQELCQLLGIEYGEQDEEEPSDTTFEQLDENALWDKLDNSDFINDYNEDSPKDEKK
jgi:hypothetical protein